MSLRLLFSIAVVCTLAACSPKNNSGNSSLSLKMPTVDELKSKSGVASQKITAANIDWAKACFMADVTGVGITDSAKTKCDVPNGIFAGSVSASVSAAQPSTLKIDDVPKGNARKIELFAYFRSSASQACAQHKSINELDPGSVASLGSTTADILNDNQTVELEISLPAAGTTLLTQYGLPGYCSTSATALGDGSARILTARGTGTTTHFKVESVVTGLATGPTLKTTSGIKIRFTHAAKDKDTQRSTLLPRFF